MLYFLWPGASESPEINFVESRYLQLVVLGRMKETARCTLPVRCPYPARNLAHRYLVLSFPCPASSQVFHHHMYARPTNHRTRIPGTGTRAWAIIILWLLEKISADNEFTTEKENQFVELFYSLNTKRC